MRILFLNYAFPGIFGPLASLFAANQENEVLFASEYSRQDFALEHVRRVVLKRARDHKRAAGEDLSPGADLDRAFAKGKATLSTLQLLRETGFIPHMVLASTSMGCSLFLREVFPEAFLAGYADHVLPPPEKECGRMLVHELVQSRHVLSCDIFFALSRWQRAQFPQALQSSISIFPFYVNTEFFSMHRAEPFFPENLTENKENAPEKRVNCAEESAERTGEPVTCAGERANREERESRRGEPVKRTVVFRVPNMRAAQKPLFLHMLYAALRHEPALYVSVFCGSAEVRELVERTAGTLFRDMLPRIHCATALPRATYRDLLCSSAVYVCTEKPGVLFADALEAMSCGVLLLAPASENTREALIDGVNAFLYQEDTDSAVSLLGRVLRQADSLNAVRMAARRTVTARYRLQTFLPRHAAQLLRAYAHWQSGKKSGAASSPDAKVNRVEAAASPHSKHEELVI